MALLGQLERAHTFLVPHHQPHPFADNSRHLYLPNQAKFAFFGLFWFSFVWLRQLSHSWKFRYKKSARGGTRLKRM